MARLTRGRSTRTPVQGSPEDAAVTHPATVLGRFVRQATPALASPDVTAMVSAGRPAGRPARSVPPVDLLRTDDLLFLHCSFLNLTFGASRPGEAPVLVRNAKNRPAFLVVTFPPQHIIELAFFQTADGVKPGATNPSRTPDPDAGATGSEPLERPPVFASVAGPSRLVFRVTNQQIVYTVEGILAAMAALDLAVAPHAVPPPPPRTILPWRDLVAGGQLNLAGLLGARVLATPKPTRAGRIPPELLAANTVALARLTRTAVNLERRFGGESALNAIAASRLGGLIDLGKVIGVGVVHETPPLPAPPTGTQTALELPWRLVVSPNDRAAWAHSTTPVGHDHRVELWHTRLGLRAKAPDGSPSVDEASTYYRTIRAVWARDFGLAGAFVSPPTNNDLPGADPKLNPPLTFRSTLNSRDRMSLVHETSNFHLLRQRRSWVPPAVPVNRMLLSTLGGWLESRVEFPTLPDGPLDIQEWKHLAGMGRDHEVKVVYAGFLLPFGHKASLVKLTERKVAQGRHGPVAYLFQRMFIVVREEEKQFTSSVILNVDTRSDLAMPLKSVRILTRVTPDIDDPAPHQLLPDPNAPFLFVPYVKGSPFPFKMLAVDGEGNSVEFRAPLGFMERALNDASFSDTTQLGLARALDRYNNHAGDAERRMPLNGQRIAYAASKTSDDTTLATQVLRFDAAVVPNPAATPQDDPRFLPLLHSADAVVPAMSALAGQASAVSLTYPAAYRSSGFTSNVAEVFLQLDTPSAMEFGGQSDRSGGFVTPSVNVSALSRMTGPIGGDVTDAVNGTFDPSKFFEGVKAKLFGVVKLTDLLKAVGFDPAHVPAFVAQTLDAATNLVENARRLLETAKQLEGRGGAVGAASTTLAAALTTLVSDVATLMSNAAATPDLAGDLTAAGAAVAGFTAAVQAQADLPRAQRDQAAGLAAALGQQAANAATAAGLITALARGELLPDVVTARMAWSTDIPRFPDSDDAAIIAPPGNPAGHHVAATLHLAVEIQAPAGGGAEPTAIVSCSITPVDLRLIGPVTFLILHFDKLEFSLTPGKKPDVNVGFRDPNGIEFAGPLEFVNTLKDIIPFNGFSDPPSLDVTSEGITAGFDLSIPSLGVGVMSLENIALGAHFNVPFIDESLEVGFNFCTREDPFRLTVMLFGGGGFFGITLTPDGVRILEASFEFGAELSINLGVASGGVSIMAGIYFKLEMVAGNTDATLTGYFRMRGEVDVLGLISASIELYLELTYETATNKAVGRATLTIEVSVLFLSFSVSISFEQKFAGAGRDPTFLEQMGLPAGAPPGTPRPWDLYCRAFA